jgi:hypothetical protein
MTEKTGKRGKEKKEKKSYDRGSNWKSKRGSELDILLLKKGGLRIRNAKKGSGETKGWTKALH